MADPEEACGPRPGESCTAPHPAGLAAPPRSLWDSTTSPAESPWLTNELLWKQTLMGCAPDRQMGCANMGINRLGLAAACSPLGTGDTEDAGHGKGEAARPPRSTAVGLVLFTCPARQVSETGALAHQSRSHTSQVLPPAGPALPGTLDEGKPDFTSTRSHSHTVTAKPTSGVLTFQATRAEFIVKHP